MKAWEIWSYQPPGWPDLHPAVIVSSPGRVANKPDLNVLMCSSKPTARAALEYEVILDSADGLNWPTLSKCDLFQLAASNVCAALLFVSPGSVNPTPPYNTWDTAAHAIQDAANAASPNDVVLVTNGAYAGGLVLAKPVWVLGVGRAQFTLIDGGGTNRCVWMTNGARLEGFTLTNGWAQNGGGVWCSSSNTYVTNCVIVGNSAAGGDGGGAWGGTIDRCTLSSNSAGSGGGAASAAINNCILTRNSCNASGGGAFQCNLNNCVLTGNSGNAAGGAFGGTLNNCTVSGNSANSGGGAQSAGLNNSIVYFNSAPSGTN